MLSFAITCPTYLGWSLPYGGDDKKQMCSLLHLPKHSLDIPKLAFVCMGGHSCGWVILSWFLSWCWGWDTGSLAHAKPMLQRYTHSPGLFVCFETMSLVCTNFKISKPSFGFSLLSYFHRWLTVFVKNSWNETIWKGKREWLCAKRVIFITRCWHSMVFKAK